MNKIGTGELLGQPVFQISVISQSDGKPTPTVLHARLGEIEEGLQMTPRRSPPTRRNPQKR